MNALLLCAVLVLPVAAQPPVGPHSGLAEFERLLNDIAAGARARSEALRASIAGRERSAAPAAPAAATVEIEEFNAYFDRMPTIVAPGQTADPRKLHIVVRVTNPTGAPLTVRIEETHLSFQPSLKGAPARLTDEAGAAAVGLQKVVAPGETGSFYLRGAFAGGRAGERLRATVTLRVGSETVETVGSTVVVDVL